jgi:glycosyltransferase involved in cell wall biosynthesis
VPEGCGRLIAPRSPEALAGALLELSNDAALRDRLGRDARRRVEATFSLDRMVMEYREVYSALV